MTGPRTPRGAVHPNGRPKHNPLRDVPPIRHVWVPPVRTTTRQTRVERTQRRFTARAKADALAARNAEQRRSARRPAQAKIRPRISWLDQLLGWTA